MEESESEDDFPATPPPQNSNDEGVKKHEDNTPSQSTRYRKISDSSTDGSDKEDTGSSKEKVEGTYALI